MYYNKKPVQPVHEPNKRPFQQQIYTIQVYVSTQILCGERVIYLWVLVLMSFDSVYEIWRYINCKYNERA